MIWKNGLEIRKDGKKFINEKTDDNNKFKNNA